MRSEFIWFDSFTVLVVAQVLMITSCWIFIEELFRFYVYKQNVLGVELDKKYHQKEITFKF